MQMVFVIRSRRGAPLAGVCSPTRVRLTYTTICWCREWQRSSEIFHFPSSSSSASWSPTSTSLSVFPSLVSTLLVWSFFCPRFVPAFAQVTCAARDHSGYGKCFSPNEPGRRGVLLCTASCRRLMKVNETPALEAESKGCGDTVGLVPTLATVRSAGMVTSRHQPDRITSIIS